MDIPSVDYALPMSMCVHMCSDICANVCVEAASLRGLFLSFISSHFLGEQVSTLNLEVTDWLDWLASDLRDLSNSTQPLPS